MGIIPDNMDALLGFWNRETNLENELYLVDYFRSESQYTKDWPLVFTKNGGLMAFFTMDGLDPEPFGQEEHLAVAATLRRAAETFSNESVEDEFKGGTWEIINYWERIEGVPQRLRRPARDSEAIHYLVDSTNAFWSQRTVYDDRITWVIQFVPKYHQTGIWKLRSPEANVEILQSHLERQAQFLRRRCRIFQEAVMAYQTPSPRMTLKTRPMNEKEIRQFVYRQANRRQCGDTEVDPDLSLLQQVCYSSRNNSQRVYQVNDQPLTVLTWKYPPKGSFGNIFKNFSDRCLFPFTICQVFSGQNAKENMARLNRNKGPATALGAKSRNAQAWLEEATEYEDSLLLDGAAPFAWKFSVVVTGADQSQYEERLGKLLSWAKTMNGGEPMEEGKDSRVIAELSTIPGNTWANARLNICTSKNVGDLAMVYRLGKGDSRPHMLFGDRNSGIYSLDLFTSKLPSWNCAVLGKPGSGKSVLMNQEVLGVSTEPFQCYILDEGNSYHSLVEFYADDMPGEVTTMRIRGGDFRFNPLPIIWAIQERERQIADGTYKQIIDGDMLPDPIEAAEQFFENWLEVLLGGGEPLSQDLKNKLDRALKGKDENSPSFFLDFRQVCQDWIDKKAAGIDMPLPRPLSQLQTFVFNEVEELGGALEIWTRGERAKYFDSGEDSISDARMVYFELTGIKDDPLLSRPFVAALMGTMWRRICDPKRLHERKAIILDEAWRWISDPVFSRVVEEIARTIRKFSGFLVLSTQTTDDLNNPDAVKLLKTMSHQFIYPGFTDENYFRKILQLTDQQIELHASLETNDKKREVLYWNATGLVRALDVVLAPVTYWFSTSNAKDKVFRSALTRKGGLRFAMEELATACEFRTIGSEDLRIAKVTEYMQANHPEALKGRSAK